MVAQDAAERLDLGGRRAPHGVKEFRKPAFADDRAQLLVGRAGHDVHVDLALGGREQRLRARDERGSHHGAEDELGVALRQALDALRIAGAAEQFLLVLGEFRAPRRAAVQVRVAHQLLHLGGVLVGIDRHIGVDLEAGRVENDAVEIEDDGLRRCGERQSHARQVGAWQAAASSGAVLPLIPAQAGIQGRTRELSVGWVPLSRIGGNMSAPLSFRRPRPRAGGAPGST
jgi:hypothetical protein